MCMKILSWKRKHTLQKHTHKETIHMKWVLSSNKRVSHLHKYPEECLIAVKGEVTGIFHEVSPRHCTTFRTPGSHPARSCDILNTLVPFQMSTEGLAGPWPVRQWASTVLKTDSEKQRCSQVSTWMNFNCRNLLELETWSFIRSVLSVPYAIQSFTGNLGDPEWGSYTSEVKV